MWKMSLEQSTKYYLNPFEKFMMVTNTMIASGVWITLIWIVLQS